MTAPAPLPAAEVLAPWLVHPLVCPKAWPDSTEACTCGLDAALASLAAPSGAAQLSEEEAEADRAALASPEGVVTPEPPPFGSVPFGTMFIPGPALLHGYNEWVDVPGPFTVPPKDLVPYQPEDPKHG